MRTACVRDFATSRSRRPWIITMLTGWARYYGFIYRWIYTELEVERNESISRRMKTLGRGQGQSFVLTTMLRFYGKFNRKERKRRKKKNKYHNESATTTSRHVKLILERRDALSLFKIFIINNSNRIFFHFYLHPFQHWFLSEINVQYDNTSRSFSPSFFKIKFNIISQRISLIIHQLSHPQGFQQTWERERERGEKIITEITLYERVLFLPR